MEPKRDPPKLTLKMPRFAGPEFRLKTIGCGCLGDFVALRFCRGGRIVTNNFEHECKDSPAVTTNLPGIRACMHEVG